MADASTVVAWARSNQRERLLADFYSFAKYSNMCPDIEPEPYKMVCDYLQSLLPNTPRIAAWRAERGLEPAKAKWVNIFALFLMPRMTFKTSLIAALCMFAIILDPDIRIVLGRATTADAKKTLDRIKSNIESNPILKGAFPSRMVFEKWTSESITTANRKPGMGDPTIDIVSLENSKVGSHPDLILLDDLVHENNFESPAIMETAQNKILACQATLQGAWGTLILMGTRWSEIDCYGWVLQRDEDRVNSGKDATWLKLVLSCWKDDLEGVPLFPSVMPAMRIEQLKENTPPKLFASWYLNKTRAEFENLFAGSYIQWFDMKEFVGGPFAEIELDDTVENRSLILRFGKRIRVAGAMLIDPAPTVGRRSDFTGIVIVFWDSERNWWVVHAEEIKKHPTDRLNHIVLLARQYPPQLVAVENADIQAPLLQEKLQDGGHVVRVVSFDPRMDRKRITRDPKLAPRGLTKKESQIDNLEPVLRARRCFFARGHTAPLIRQLLAYPQLEHDDVIDAFSMAQAYESFPEVSVDRNPDRIFEEIEAREFLLEGLDFDGADLDAPKGPMDWKAGRYGYEVPRNMVS